MTNQQGAPEARRCALIAAAQAVVDRWDTPLWKDVPATAEYIGRLRATLVEAQQPAPSAVAAEIDGGPPGSGGWEKHAIEMERQRDFYRQRCHTMEEHQNGGVWYWQGDDGDNLESMGNSMLVVIRADQLRALIAAPQPSPTPQADSQPAPLIDAEAVAYNEWFNGEQGTAYDGMWAFARAAWMTRAARAPAASVTAPAGVASMREDFEAYWRSKYAPLPMNTRLHDDGRYGDPTIQQEWESWRATHTPTQPTQAADSVLEDAAPRAAERPTVIPVPGGAELHFEPYLIDSPQTLWRLRRNGVHIRWLNEYEQGFVNAAIDAARKQGGAT